MTISIYPSSKSFYLFSHLQWLLKHYTQVMILIIIFIFAFTAYTTNVNLGSPSKVYDLLTQAAKAHPVAGNAEGSYLTMKSKEGAIFFVINIVGNFGTVFMDNGKALFNELCYKR